MTSWGLKRRAKRALERQLDYQVRKAEQVRGDELMVVAHMVEKSRLAKDKIETIRKLSRDCRVLEVGSGAHGLIFYFDAADKTGVDPLADEYRQLFPHWQERVKIIAAFGEQLPFADGSFDVVLCDNVIDHAEHPAKIVDEMARVLAPGGILYFTVNIHHPIYHWAATAHAAWRGLGVPLEITPFADHTVHLTRTKALGFFSGLPLKIVRLSDTIAETKAMAKKVAPRRFSDRLKRLFFKNANLEVIAVHAP